MLEMPESCTISKQVNENLVGKCIREYEMLHSPHRFAFFKGECEKYDDILVGKKITGATFHGGIIQINIEDGMIMFADGAYPRYFESEAKPPKKHQFVLRFEDESALYVSIQMYGEIFIYPQGECKDAYYLSASTKPNPLTDEFTLDYLRGIFTQEMKKLTAKAFLATEQRIPGIGNGVLQDILWDAGLDPRHVVCEEDLEVLYYSIRKILKQMIDAGGRDTEKLMLGDKGGYMTQLSKNSVYQPCMKCGNEIHKANYMGGTVYFCDHCQKR